MWRRHKKRKKKKHGGLRRRRKWRTGFAEWEVREEQENRNGRCFKMGKRQNTILQV
jgi:hypothetical protein